MAKFEIAKPGFNVLTTADKNKVYSSKYRTYKVELESSVDDTISVGDTEELLTINHNLGYYPVMYVWLSRGGETHEVSGTRRIEFSGSVEIIASFLHINTNTTRLFLFPVGGIQVTTRTFTWSYKIMKDEF